METSELTLRNGLVVTPSGVLRGGIAVSGGVITHVGADATLPRGTEDVDVGGKVIFPGVIDPHCHLGVGDGHGPEKLESDFVTESRDAAAGGVTTLVSTTVFGTESRVWAVEDGIRRGTGTSQVDFRFNVVMTLREHCAEVAELTQRLGCRSFKFFTGYNGAQAASFGMLPEGVVWDFFWEACEAIAAAHPRAFPMIHAEEPNARNMLNDRMRATGRTDYLQSWHEASPNILEPIQIYPAALIAHEHGCPLYVVHVSAWESVELIRDLHARGWDVVGETLGAFLYWTAGEGDAKGLGAYGKIQPPIRGPRDRDELWRGVNDGTITLIGTDCQQYTIESQQGDFWDARVGLGPLMGTLLPSCVTAGLRQGRCSLDTLARTLAENTARRFDLYPQKGVLQVGSDADVVVFDPNASKPAKAAELHSISGYTIYEDEELYGWPELVYVRGTLVSKDGAIVAEQPIGRYVPA